MITRLTHLFAVTAAAAALAAPSAVARPAEDRPEPAPAPTVVREIESGFDWGSAAIGAGSGAALVLLALGGVTVATNRPLRHAR